MEEKGDGKQCTDAVDAGSVQDAQLLNPPLAFSAGAINLSSASTMPQSPSVKNTAPKRIPRPMNAFMIFSNENRGSMRSRFPLLQNKELSKRLGAVWRKMNKEEQDVYYRKAKLASEEHRKKYPNYHYRPRGRGQNGLDKKSAKSVPLVNPSPAVAATPGNLLTANLMPLRPQTAAPAQASINVSRRHVSGQHHPLVLPKNGLVYSAPTAAPIYQQYLNTSAQCQSAGVVSRPATASGIISDGAHMLSNSVSMNNLRGLYGARQLSQPYWPCMSQSGQPLFVLNNGRPIPANSLMPNTLLGPIRISHADSNVDDTNQFAASASSILTPPPSHAGSTLSTTSPPSAHSAYNTLQRKDSSFLEAHSSTAFPEYTSVFADESDGPRSCMNNDLSNDGDDSNFGSGDYSNAGFRSSASSVTSGFHSVESNSQQNDSCLLSDYSNDQAGDCAVNMSVNGGCSFEAWQAIPKQNFDPLRNPCATPPLALDHHRQTGERRITSDLSRHGFRPFLEQNSNSASFCSAFTCDNATDFRNQLSNGICEPYSVAATGVSPCDDLSPDSDLTNDDFTMDFNFDDDALLPASTSQPSRPFYGLEDQNVGSSDWGFRDVVSDIKTDIDIAEAQYSMDNVIAPKDFSFLKNPGY